MKPIEQKIKKSPECSKVLQLMDDGLTYEQALKSVLTSSKGISKDALEKELNKYI